MITVDATKLQLFMDVSDEELAKRKAAWKPPPPNAPRQEHFSGKTLVDMIHMGPGEDRISCQVCKAA